MSHKLTCLIVLFISTLFSIVIVSFPPPSLHCTAVSRHSACCMKAFLLGHHQDSMWQLL